jgi:GGDEF domain-containing protein
MLTVKYTDESYEPVWSYYRGDDEKAQMLWQHPTGDIYLVLNLCASETGQQEQEFLPSGPNKDPSRQSYTALELEDMGGAQITTLVGPPAGKIATLEGDLSNMQLSTLLQSISMSKMTGCLRVSNPLGSANIFFEDGTPTHAESLEAKGDQAIIELVTWEEGEFHFYPDEKSLEKTVKRRVDGLLMEGVGLLDQNKYVKEQGLKPQSYLIRVNDRLTEEEFKTVLSNKGAPLDMDTQKRFYGFIDNASTFLDVLRRMPMIKNEWVPLMFNMLSCGLVRLSDTPPAGVVIQPVLNLPEFQIDRPAIQGVLRSITRPETGLLTYPAFLYMLEQDFTKSATLGIPLCLLVFEAKLRVGDALQSLPMQFIRECVKRVESAKRPIDVMGHFETFDFAIFMPNTQVKSAKVFAARLMEMLAADPFVPRPFGQLALFFGIAGAPEDTMELNVMLSAARECKRRGIEGGTPVTTLKELGQR